jgi:spermidine/putrescine transport system substrate-binding protein
LSLPGAAGCTRSPAGRLNVYNWSNYVGAATISTFEREFGVEVRYGIFESNEEMLAKALTGNSGWDVVFPSNYFIRPMRENGLLARLRHEWLPGLENLDRRFHAPEWDPALEWSVPYMSGASGIFYRSSLHPAPAAWRDLWDGRLRGRMTMLDDPAEVIGACLKKLGLPLNSCRPEDLERARREAVAQKKLLRAYLNAEVRDQVVSGDVLAAQLWATTAQQGIDASPGLAFAYPAEGFALYCDNAVVLRESARQELAHRFIDYLLRPQVAAGIVIETRTATVNAAALAILPQGVRANPTLYPPQEVLERGEWFAALDAQGQRLRDRLWTEIKAS